METSDFFFSSSSGSSFLGIGGFNDTAARPTKVMSSSASHTILTSITFYFPLLLCSFILFEFLRQKFPTIYDPRKATDDIYESISSLDRNQGWFTIIFADNLYIQSATNFFGWIPLVFCVSNETIAHQLGLDALFFLRVLRMGQKLTLLCVLTSFILLPLYASSHSSSEDFNDKRLADPLQQFDLSHLPAGDARFWAPAATAYIISFALMYILLEEYKEYVRLCHEVMCRPEPAQYSVLITDLPKSLRTRKTLDAFLRPIFPDTIRFIEVLVNCDELEKLVKEREEARGQLEYALTMKHHNDNQDRRDYIICHPEYKHRWSLCTLSRVPRVDGEVFWRQRLEFLNHIVAEEIMSIENAQSLLAQRISYPSTTPLDSPASSVPPSHTSPPFASPVVSDIRTPITSDGKDEIKELEKRDEYRRKYPRKVMKSAAFVSFTSLQSAHVAQQSIQSSDPTKIMVSFAPHEEDVDWGSIGKGYRARFTGMTISVLATTLIVVFWTIPTALIASLSTVESLKRIVPFLDDLIDAYPDLESYITQLAPLLVVSLRALAPVIFRFLSNQEGHVAESRISAAVFTKLGNFQLIQLFFVTVIVGTVVDSIKEILDQPKLLISWLGRSMPQQSTFFITYVIVLTALSNVMEILRIPAFLVHILFLIFAPTKTRRQRQSEWYFLRPVTYPKPFDSPKVLADSFFVMLISLTFAPIAPLVCYFTGMFFIITELVYRRQLLYVYKPVSYATGFFWPKLYNFLIVALIVSQITLLGVLSLKQAAGESTSIVLLVIITLLFHNHVSSLYPEVAKQLPLSKAAAIDEERNRSEQTQAFFSHSNVYRQPAMEQQFPVAPEPRMIGTHYVRETSNCAILSPTSSSKEDATGI